MLFRSDKYNALLVANGIITVEMLKAVLKDKDTTGKYLLSFGDTIVEWYRTARARQTFLHKRTCSAREGNGSRSCRCVPCLVSEIACIPPRNSRLCPQRRCRPYPMNGQSLSGSSAMSACAERFVWLLRFEIGRAHV